MSELILAIGDDNVEFQNLDKSAVSLDYHHKKGTTITFGTEAKISPKEGQLTEKIGLVLWLDRQAVADAMSEAKAK